MRSGVMFGARGERSERSASALPQAIRPAVEIIARLSAERARLRAELARLRTQSDESSLRAELEQVKAERDALRQELFQLRGARETAAAGGSDAGLRGLVDRLERSLGRLESATREVQAISGSYGREAPAPRAKREQRRPAPVLGNGMMAALVRQNLTLRDEPAPAPAPAPVAPAGGGMLSALVRENSELRRGGSRRSRSPAPPANPLAGLVEQNKALRRVTSGVHRKSLAA